MTADEAPKRPEASPRTCARRSCAMRHPHPHLPHPRRAGHRALALPAADGRGDGALLWQPSLREPAMADRARSGCRRLRPELRSSRARASKRAITSTSPSARALDVYEAELPPDAERLDEANLRRQLYQQPKGSPRVAGLVASGALQAAALTVRRPRLFPSSDALWQQPKYSRTVDAVDFNSQDEARIGAINRRVYNFYRPSTKKGPSSRSRLCQHRADRP